MKITAYKFTNTDQKISQSIIDNAESFLKDKLSNKHNFGTDGILHYGVYRYMGWEYDFRPLLKRFLYKQPYTHWCEMWALNKTQVRRFVTGKIIEIHQI